MNTDWMHTGAIIPGLASATGKVTRVESGTAK